MEDNSGSKFLYFLTGLGIGALIGILFAPQSGEKTRELIAGRAEEGRDYLTQKGRTVRDQAAYYVDRGKEAASSYVDRGKEAVAHQRDQLASAIEAGRQAYRTESGQKTGE
jgi:gas vesicle protein